MPQKLLLPTFITTLLCLAGIVWLLTTKNTPQALTGTETRDEDVTEKTFAAAPDKTKDREIPILVANAAMRAYRDRVAPGGSKLMIYKPELLVQYLSNNFLRSTSQQNPPPGYEWRIALAPSYFNVSGNLKLGAIFTPVLVNSSDTTQVIDYYDAMRSSTPGNPNDYYTQYFEPLNNRSIANGKISIFYDESQLWP